MRSLGHSRNGPPDAVSVTFSIACDWPKSRSWNAALCSESTGTTVARDCASVSRKTSPAATTHSLLASAIVAPRRAATSVGSSAAAPTIATIATSLGLAAACKMASAPAPSSILSSASAARRSSYRPASATAAKRGRKRRACSASTSTLDWAVSASIGKAWSP